jgi:hypothetical protein
VISQYGTGTALLHHGPGDAENGLLLRTPIDEVACKDNHAVGMTVDAVPHRVAKVSEQALQWARVTVNVADYIQSIQLFYFASVLLILAIVDYTITIYEGEASVPCCSAENLV